MRNAQHNPSMSEMDALRRRVEMLEHAFLAADRAIERLREHAHRANLKSAVSSLDEERPDFVAFGDLIIDVKQIRLISGRCILFRDGTVQHISEGQAADVRHCLARPPNSSRSTPGQNGGEA